MKPPKTWSSLKIIYILLITLSIQIHPSICLTFNINEDFNFNHFTFCDQKGQILTPEISYNPDHWRFNAVHKVLPEKQIYKIDIYGVYSVDFEGFLLKKCRDNSDKSIVEINDSLYYLSPSKPFRVLLFSVISTEELTKISEIRGIENLKKYLEPFTFEHQAKPVNKLYMSIYKENMDFPQFMRSINANKLIFKNDYDMLQFRFQMSKDILKRFIRDNFLFDILDTKLNSAIRVLELEIKAFITQEKVLEDEFMKTIEQVVSSYSDFKKNLKENFDDNFFYELFQKMVEKLQEKVEKILIPSEKLLFLNMALFRSPMMIFNELKNENVSKVVVEYALSLADQTDFFIKEVPTCSQFFDHVHQELHKISEIVQKFTSKVHNCQKCYHLFKEELLLDSEKLGNILIEPISPFVEKIEKDLEKYLKFMRQNADVEQLGLFNENPDFIDLQRLNEIYKFLNPFGNKGLTLKVLDVGLLLEE